MAPRWPRVTNGPEHINEHATYLREACNQLQAVDRGRQNQVPWNIVQPYLESTLALVGKVLRQPALGEVLQHVQAAAKCTQSLQADITIIKNSVGLSTAPPNRTNFSRDRPTASWAQVAAQAKGSPPQPPPTSTKNQPTVTAYKDRVVTIKLRDQGITQRYRAHSAAWTRQQVETSIRNNAATKTVKVVAAHQLKSGDIQIFTSTTAESSQLKENKGWLRGLGEHAELIVPTYGVIVHGIATSSINIKEQETTIQQMLADNYTVIPNAKISYVGWLTKEATLKRASSIVVEFTDPELANAIIYAGMAWDGQIHQCQLYDRACRVKQCFRCYNYGHIGTQCNASQTCGYCTERHETKNCRKKGMEGFTPRCAVCKGAAHTAWSNACPERRKEMRRVEQAKEARSIYWHVPLREKSTPGTDHIRTSTRSEKRRHAAPTQSQPATERPGEARPTTPENRPTTRSQKEQETIEVPTSTETAEAAGVTATQTPAAPSVVEIWGTPATQPEATQEPELLIDPQLLTGEPLSPAQIARDELSDPSPYPEGGLEGAVLQEADLWLDNLANDSANAWLQAPEEDEPSPPTSMATDTRTAHGTIYKGCRCPEHQDIYNSWPTHNAELRIAKCMRVCVYCGKDFPVAAELRKHMRKVPEYAQRNVTVYMEPGGRATA